MRERSSTARTRAGLVLLGWLVSSALFGGVAEAVPTTPSLTSTTPASPANANNPTVNGSVTPVTTVRLYTTSNCSGAVLASGISNATGQFSIAISVPDNSTTVIRARAQNSSGLSPCSAPRTYVEDSVAPPAPRFSDLRRGFNPAQTQPVLTGIAESGSLVWVFKNAVCAGPVVAQGTASAGSFSVPLNPVVTTTYSARSVDAAGNVSACTSRPIVYHAEHPMCPAVPEDLPMTRTPIRGEWGNHSILWMSHHANVDSTQTVDPPDGVCPPAADKLTEDWDCYLAELTEYDPELLGHAGMTSFNTGFTVAYGGGLELYAIGHGGLADRIHGDDQVSPLVDIMESCDIDPACRPAIVTPPATVEDPYPASYCAPQDESACVDVSQTEVTNACLLSEAEMVQRVAALQQFNSTMSFTRVFPYTDFGTQIYGNHVTQSGFFRFFKPEVWDAYEVPFGLGPRPPEPCTWLSRLPNSADPCLAQDHDDLAGLNFIYGSSKLQYDSAAHCFDASLPTYYRYTVASQTEGWQMWWPQAMKESAQAGYKTVYVDNAVRYGCWNAECEAGYTDWLQDYGTQHGVSPAEMSSLFTRTRSLTFDPGFEGDWLPLGGGWTGQSNTMYPYVGTISKDPEAYRGSFSAKLVSGTPLPPPADQWKISVFAQTVKVPQEDHGKALKVSFWYRTSPNAGPTYVLIPSNEHYTMPNYVPLSPSTTWVQFSIDLSVAPGAPAWDPLNMPEVAITLLMASDGVLWLDELHVVPDGSPGNEPATEAGLATPGQLGQDNQNRLRAWATTQYFDSVVDENVPKLKQAGLSVTPDFKLFINAGQQRRGADYYMVERQAVDVETWMHETSSSPGTYLPNCDPGVPGNRIIKGGGDCFVGLGTWFAGGDANFQTCEVTQPITVSNILDYKSRHALKLADEFSYHYQSNLAEQNYKHTEDTVLLHFAEVAAFGGGAVADINMASPNWLYGKQERQVLRARLKGLTAWADANATLYECLSPQADVALVVRENDIGAPYMWANISRVLRVRMGERLSEKNILWHVLSDVDIGYQDLSRFKAVVYYDEWRVSESEANALGDYLNDGGVVVALGAMAVYDEQYRQRTFVSGSAWPPVALDPEQTETHHVGAGWLISSPRPSGLDPHQWPGAAGLDDLVTYVTQYAGATLPTLPPPLPAATAKRMRVAAWAGYSEQIVHLINYDVPFGWQPCSGVPASPANLTNVTVRLSAPSGWTPGNVRIHSPESGVTTGVLPVTYDPVTDTVSFVVPSMHIYSVAQLY